MKLSNRMKSDITCLIEHSLRDIRYGSEGMYWEETKHGDFVTDYKAIEQSKRAIAFLEKLIQSPK